MNKEEDEIKRLREAATRVKINRGKQSIRFPRKIIVPLIWTAFFMIIGLVQRSIVEGRFVIKEFFYKYYSEWFYTFGNFSRTYLVSSMDEVMNMIIRDWYYFFITGGILSLIVSIIYVILHKDTENKEYTSMYIDNILSR